MLRVTPRGRRCPPCHPADAPSRVAERHRASPTVDPWTTTLLPRLAPCDKATRFPCCARPPHRYSDTRGSRTTSPDLRRARPGSCTSWDPSDNSPTGWTLRTGQDYTAGMLSRLQHMPAVHSVGYRGTSRRCLASCGSGGSRRAGPLAATHLFALAHASSIAREASGLLRGRCLL